MAIGGKTVEITPEANFSDAICGSRVTPIIMLKSYQRVVALQTLYKKTCLATAQI